MPRVIQRRAGAALFVCIGVMGAAARQSEAASFQGLGDLPGNSFYSDARAVSSDGRVVVGSSYSANGTEAFRWTAGEGMVGMGDFAGGYFTSYAQGISADGSMIVGSSNELNGKGFGAAQAYVWTAATDKQRLPDFANIVWHNNSTANAISADGSTFAGQVSNYDTSPGFSHASYWRGGESPVDLGDLPLGINLSCAYAVSADGSVVTGFANSEPGREAFRWTAESGMVGLGDLSGGGYGSAAYGISPDGSILVGYGTVDAGAVPMRWTEEGGMQALSDSSLAVGGEARGISADGSIIVGKSNGFGAFIWDESHGMRSLLSALSDDYGLGDVLAGWKLTAAYAITPDGSTIIGTGKNPAGNTEAWIAVVPEPASGLMLFLLTPLALRRRRR